jgi:menaquinone-dependent protoporphyrinogen oxidase
MEVAMLNILVLYGTTEGQTAKIGRFLGDALRAEGVLADVRDARTAAPAPDGYDAVIVAGSVHAGGYQRSVRRWVREHAHVLNEKPTAFVSVCLGVLQREPKVQQELAAILSRFFALTGWRATVTRTVAGALPYSRYNWVKRWAMVRIVRKAGGDTDTSRDYEYTDWADLRGFAKDFLRVVRGRTATAAVGHAAGG